MRHFFLDTNVVFDYLGRREPNGAAAAALFQAAYEGKVTLHVASLSFSHVFYTLRKQFGPQPAREALRKLARLVSVVAVDAGAERTVTSPYPFPAQVHMRTILRVACTALVLGLSAGPPLAAQVRVADHTYGGSGMETGRGSLATADGGFLLGASTISAVSGEVSQPAPAPNSNLDFWLVKTNGQGTKLWDKRYGGNDDDRLLEVLPATDGGYLLCGWSTSGAGYDKTEPSRGGTDYWVVKVDTQGNKLWDKRFGGSDHDYLVTAVAAPDGGYLLCGWTGTSPATPASTAPNGDRSESLLGDSDIWLVKLDAQGSKLWDKRLGGASHDYVYGAVNAPGGGFVLVGSPMTGGPGSLVPGGDVTGSGFGSTDYWVVKVDAQGTPVWDRLYGGSQMESVRAVLATTDGGLLVSGLSESPISGNKTVPAGEQECWVLKLDAQGDKLWERAYGGPLWEVPTTLQNNPRGGYFLGGNIGYTDPVGSPMDMPNDMWLASIDAGGQLRWQAAFGGNDEEYLNGILPLDSGNLLLVGSSSSNASRDKTANSRGIYDIWTVEVGNLVSSNRPVAPQVQAALFPNPAEGLATSLHIDGLSAQPSVKLEVLNALGQVVQTEQLPVREGSIRHGLRLAKLTPGVYTVRLHTLDGMVTRRLVKN